MIDPRELRIGNWLRRYDGIDDPVVGINGDRIITFIDTQKVECLLEEYSPIELTPEWLERAGFKKRESGTFKNVDNPYWVRESICLFFTETPPENTYLIGIGFMYNGEYLAGTTVWITKVHELQNAYRELKHKELEFKPI